MTPPEPDKDAEFMRIALGVLNEAAPLTIARQFQLAITEPDRIRTEVIAGEFTRDELGAMLVMVHHVVKETYARNPNDPVRLWSGCKILTKLMQLLIGDDENPTW